MPVVAPRIGEETVELDGARDALPARADPVQLAVEPRRRSRRPAFRAASSTACRSGSRSSARASADATVLRAAHAFQQVTGWHERRPARCIVASRQSAVLAAVGDRRRGSGSRPATAAGTVDRPRVPRTGVVGLPHLRREALTDRRALRPHRLRRRDRAPWAACCRSSAAQGAAMQAVQARPSLQPRLDRLFASTRAPVGALEGALAAARRRDAGGVAEGSSRFSQRRDRAHALSAAIGIDCRRTTNVA